MSDLPKNSINTGQHQPSTAKQAAAHLLQMVDDPDVIFAIKLDGHLNGRGEQHAYLLDPSLKECLAQISTGSPVRNIGTLTMLGKQLLRIDHALTQCPKDLHPLLAREIGTGPDQYAPAASTGDTQLNFTVPAALHINNSHIGTRIEAERSDEKYGMPWENYTQLQKKAEAFHDTMRILERGTSKGAGFELS